jgi:hypothetical protein
VALHTKIAEMIALDEQPFSIVEDVGFRRLVETAVPLYQIPSRTFFSKKMVPDLHKRVSGKIIEFFQCDPALKISFTSDMWTSSSSNESFLSLTAHWITGQCVRMSAVLSVKHFVGRHTGDLIRISLLEILSQWSLSSASYHALVHDNGANMVKAVRDSELLSISCFAHSLQLCIKDAIFSQRAIADIIAICKKIVGHFSHSPAAARRLKQLQLDDQANGSEVRKLVQDVVTRWNSTLHMMESLQDQKRVLRMYALENEEFQTLMPNQWILLEKVITLLQPFEEITKEICRDDAALSLVIPAVHVLRAFLSRESAEQDAGVGTLKASLLESVIERFSTLHDSQPHVLATLVDPRFKLAYFGTPEDRVRAKAELLLQVSLSLHSLIPFVYCLAAQGSKLKHSR